MSACPFCSGGFRPYIESDRWLLCRHADPVAIPGWMMLVARAHRSGLDEMSDIEQREVGAALAAIARAVRAETGCQRTYSITFNEAVPHLHLHVIPRHADDPSTASWALADRYRATARKELAPADPSDTERVAAAIALRALPALAALGFRVS